MVLRAVEELKMLAQNDLERERYEARRKALLDYHTGLNVAREELRRRRRGAFVGHVVKAYAGGFRQELHAEVVHAARAR